MARTCCNNDIVDLKAIGLKWAKEMFRQTKTCKQWLINKKYLNYTIDWSNVVFEFDKPIYIFEPTMLYNYDCHRVSENVRPRVIFSTVFINQTDCDQEFSFKTERITRSTAKIILENGISFGQEMAVKLKVPSEVIEASAGFKHEIIVTKTDEDTTEEELTWAVDNIVKVPPLTETTAELVVEEARHQGTFRMCSRFHGPVRVLVTNLSRGNSLVSFIDGSVDVIIKETLGEKLQERGFAVDRGVVSFETNGKCCFKYGIKQRVRITKRPLPPAADRCASI